MADVNALPDEMLVMIIEQLQFQRAVIAIALLLPMSRDLGALTMQLLWSKITVGEEHTSNDILSH